MSEMIVPAEIKNETVVFEVIPADVCFDWFAKQIKDNTKRVSVQAMAYELDSETKGVLHKIGSSAIGGVEATCIVDGYSMIFGGDYLSFLPTRQGFRAKKEIKKLKNHLNQLEDNGVSIRTVREYGKVGSGLARLNPYANRNHIKGYSTDKVVGLMGPNFQESATRKYDFMLATTDETIVSWWNNFVDYEFKHGVVPGDDDYSVDIDTETKVLVDVGLPKKSLIYDTACELIQSPDVAEILYYNQMFPAGKIKDILHKQQQKLGQEKVQIVTTAYDQFAHPARLATWLRQRNSHLAYKTPQDKPIHTKTVVVTMQDGSRTAIVTTNNLDERGINYGTAEIAVVTTNDKSIENIVGYCSRIPTVEPK